MDPYRDSIEHLADELKRVDLMIRRLLTTILRENPAHGSDEYRGLVISEPEIQSLLESGEFLRQHWHKQATVQEKLEPFDRKMDEARKTISQRMELTEKAGRRLALPYLADRFGLSAAEVDLLLIALAPELEPHYETLYAYLQDDVTRHRPGVNLALNLISRSEREKLLVRRFFSPGAPLLHFRMFELQEEQHDKQPTLLRKFVKVDDSLLGFLLDHPPAALPLGTYVSPKVSIEGLETGASTRDQLANLTDSLMRTGYAGAIVRIVAQTRAEQQPVAEALAHALNKPLIFVTSDDLQDASKTNAMVRDSALRDAAIAILAPEETPSSSSEEQAKPEQQRDTFWPLLESAPGPVLALGPATAFPDLPHTAHIWRLDVAPPDFESRREAWQTEVGAAPNIEVNRLAETFRFGAPQIRQTSALAYSLAALRNPSNPEPNMEDILKAGRSLTAPTLSKFATAIEPRYGWDDIVLPEEEKRQQLERIAARVRHRSIVHREWGFEAKLSRGKGLNVLFTGASGVGKTMAAEVLAKELSLVLYQIDLSAVVSKYIGQTEKHLSAIFREAEMSQNLLFFDEADSLFGKRTEVTESRDRYANLEVNYLLQRIEQYEGLVVLSTNLQRNLDDAFLRRMQDVVDFPLPGEQHRELIWRRHLPDAAAVEPDIDFGFLARQFKLTGGAIKNAVLTAAFLAAENPKRKIGMDEMIRAVRIELQKQGKLVMKSDFGKWFETAHQPTEKELT